MSAELRYSKEDIKKIVDECFANLEEAARLTALICKDIDRIYANLAHQKSALRLLLSKLK